MSCATFRNTVSVAATAIAASVDSDTATSGSNAPRKFEIPEVIEVDWGTARADAETCIGGRRNGATTGKLIYQLFLQTPLRRVCGERSAAEIIAITEALCLPAVVYSLLRSAERRADRPRLVRPLDHPARIQILIDNFYSLVSLMYQRRGRRAVTAWMAPWIYPILEVAAGAIPVGMHPIPELVIIKRRSQPRSSDNETVIRNVRLLPLDCALVKTPTGL
ncbi:hypothetical protein B0H17DRAFT_1094312 [Mycena rosella]|uniref:Uncharacterized protein n=1 Tax=Mycena rosella TaxID=1033263 RepID=A0AAD7G352_MYCRO|nr:hypothetical protein B0H17DRAFT_1094312 [Mycena rosella]